ncbi:MAG TPA: acetate--CoA ligase family protein [Dehalococcoidales bacterium]|nr:acetate--CoA ligase family protein [Dehalococcoidales bacterium]
MSTLPDIKSLFEPRSVAIIGASRDPSKIGNKFVQNIIASGFKGEIYPVNSEGIEVLGRTGYKSILDIPGPVDIACVVIPAKVVYDCIKDCAAKGVKHAAIIASGFSETGNYAEEKKLVGYAREHGMRILGPNIFGIYSAAASLNATFGPADVRPGKVGVITQSGALGIGLMGKTVTQSIGLSAIISVGNKADINECDLLEYLLGQEQTKIILMYLEGVGEGERLVALLKRATREKPIVVIKSGRSKKGALAAASHTSSLAGEDKLFDDIIRQCGVMRSESISDALDWCHYIADNPIPKGENTVIITNGGGMGVLAADASEKYNVNLYDDLNDLGKTFSGVIPSFGSSKNPIDLSGQATAAYYDTALTAALQNKSIDSVVCLACETAVFDPEGFLEIIRKQVPAYLKQKPLVLSLFGGARIENCLNIFQKENIPAFADVYETIALLGAIYANSRSRSRPVEPNQQVDIDIGKLNEIIKKVRADGRTFLLANEARAVMEVAGINVPKSALARNIDEAVKAAEKIGYPVVLKIVSKDIIHKSDAGGVALDLVNRDEVITAYEAIMQNVRAYKADAVIQGVEVGEMVRPEIETIVAARRDHAFGPVVMFGLGGIYVEVMKDVAFRAFPLTRHETMEMISQVHSYPLLLGVRGEKRKDIDAVADTVVKIGTILKNCKDISDIEVNPLVAYPQGEGVVAVDVRILLSASQEGSL